MPFLLRFCLCFCLYVCLCLCLCFFICSSPQLILVRVVIFVSAIAVASFSTSSRRTYFSLAFILASSCFCSSSFGVRVVIIASVASRRRLFQAVPHYHLSQPAAPPTGRHSSPISHSHRLSHFPSPIITTSTHFFLPNQLFLFPLPAAAGGAGFPPLLALLAAIIAAFSGAYSWLNAGLASKRMILRSGGACGCCLRDCWRCGCG